MANLSKERRMRMISFLETLREANKDDISSLRAINEIEQALNEKKYGLVWEEHSEHVDVASTNNILSFTEDKDKIIEFDSSKPYNFLLEGDNLYSLKVLEKTHRGKIDVIYIDPPYNTGAKDWKYDNDYVDINDTYRHSKWLSFMYERLVIAKKLLARDGVICVTIDDYELPTLWLLMDELFGFENRLGTVVIRNNPKGRMNKAKVSQVHEYALFYRVNSSGGIKKIEVKPEDKSHNYILDENGQYFVKVNLRKQGIDSEAERPDGTLKDRYFPVYYNSKTSEISVEEPQDITIYPIDDKGNKRIWRRDKQGIMELFKNNDLIVNKVKDKHQIYFRFRGGLDGQLPKSIWYDAKYSASEYGTRILSNLIGREKFQYPKSLYAVEDCIRIMSNNKNATVLDFFAGSGTTGHAVIDLNKADGGNRKYILCTNNENNICEEVTYQRLKNIQDELPHNLKYFKSRLIEKKLNQSLLLELLPHIKSLIELEYACSVERSSIRIFLDEIEFDEFMNNEEQINLSKIFLASDILLSAEQEQILAKSKCDIIRIPEYYYRDELIESGDI